MSETAGSRQRLLIVDDSKVIRVTARKILRDHFDTVEAVDGENGWELLNNEGPFSLIVSDLTMPNLDGFGLLERIRNSQQPDIRDIPVIIITGANDTDATRSRATQVGATDFISKPFDSVQLLARTQAHASNRTSNRELQQHAFALEEQAKSDSLTGLPNEAAFMDLGYQQLSYAIRHKTSLAIFLLEIDDFTELENRHGKPATEAALQHVAGTLGFEVRQEDVVARTGAARFSLLLPGMNPAGIRNLSERINKSVGIQPLRESGECIRITVSIGVSAPEIRRDTRLSDLLSEAGNHLRLARSAGGDQVVFDNTSPRRTTAVKTTTNPVETVLELVNVTTTEMEASAPLMADPDPGPTDVAAIVCRETRFPGSPNSEPATLSSGSSEILPDAPVAKHGQTRTQQAETHIQATLVATGSAHFDLENAELDIDETIVITAPFYAHSDETLSESPGCAVNSDHTGTADGGSSSTKAVFQARDPDQEQHVVAKTWQPLENDLESDEAEEEPQRPVGFFRRMFRSLRPSFGRQKKRL